LHDDELNAVLKRMCPQSFALLRFECGTEMLRIGARELISNPRLAVGSLGPVGARSLAHALLAVGQQHVACAETMLQLAAEAESTPEKRDSGAD
jgi:hypothetical protein